MGKIIIQMFPESYIALNQELIHHPELQMKLAQLPANEFEIRLSTIAAEFGIILDGYYIPEELEKLAALLVNKLKEKRVIFL